MVMSNILLPLNDTTVIFLHPDDTHLPSPYVVQVTIKSDSAHTVDTIATFFEAQHEISDLVTRIVITHLDSPLPSAFTLEHDRYTLTAKYTKWPFGREKLKFSWGEDPVFAGGEKWSFFFKPIRAATSTGGILGGSENSSG
ncbi:hypothetical protein B0H21DRAFT_38485 [Amylocystis lapponica]|nr:hypothetical protein B0H21DRAFT_38485 [Amylocystis lapponica]